MADAQIAQAAIDVFTAYYHQLEDGVTGFIAEDSIEPLVDARPAERHLDR